MSKSNLKQAKSLLSFTHLRIQQGTISANEILANLSSIETLITHVPRTKLHPDLRTLPAKRTKSK